MNIIEFLQARIEDDQAALARLGDVLHSPKTQLYVGNSWVASPIRKERLLAECAAKRAIIDLFPIKQGELGPLGTRAMEALAAVYSDHQDFQEEWA